MNKDKYGRKISYLRISVTDRCNLRCIYCMPQEGIKLFPHQEILTYEEIIKITKASKQIGIDTVRITGGEPLIRKNLSFLISQIRNIEGIRDLAITTNGILLDKLLPELFSAGLKRVNISLDSLKRDRFFNITRQDSLQEVLKGIDRSLEIGLTPIKINMVVIKGINDDEIIDFVKLTEERPLIVRFIEYMPWGSINNWGEEKIIKAKEIKSIIEKEFGKILPVDINSRGPADNYQIDGFKGFIGFINPLSEHFCGKCNRIRLTADGKLKLCLFSQQEIDIKAKLRAGTSLEELTEFISNSIHLKPEKIDLDSHIKNHPREMSQIGG
ncbi:MAG: GTP 3',8-cyclase MoaA [Proteobacteria bacterium]|nr:GTP 3',8-cyclase MoaA [Pseudomonadota bacterium]